MNASTEKSQPEGKRIMPEPRFRHYPLIRALGFDVDVTYIRDKVLLHVGSNDFYETTSSHEKLRRHMINTGYLHFWGEYRNYFIDCVENISSFTSA